MDIRVPTTYLMTMNLVIVDVSALAVLLIKSYKLLVLIQPIWGDSDLTNFKNYLQNRELIV